MSTVATVESNEEYEMHQASNLEFVPIKNDVWVGVAPSLELITTYVLKEQGDWFEDEIKFIRRLIRPGMRAVDIGANHGVYALTLAKLVGPTGRVWAIEPDPVPMGRLRASVKRNGLENITLVEAGLSNRAGRASLFTSEQSELNTLTPTAGSATREIDIKTLDGCAAELQMSKIDFVKLDAEGEESRILEQAGEFLGSEDPLLMFELKHGRQVNLPLIGQFEELGYHCYRLVPGLDILVPYAASAGADDFLLNLFVCKDTRASKLEREGFLVMALDDADRAEEGDGNIWRETVAELPYAKLLMKAWQEGVKEQGWERYEHALNCCVRAHTAGLGARAKYLLLEDALQTLTDLFPDSMNFARAQTLARVAWEMGLRATAVRALEIMLNMYRDKQEIRLDEPFLPVCPRYDLLDPNGAVGRWLLSSILEQYETLRAYSSFFVRPAIGNLEAMAKLGFQSPEMKSRLMVAQQRRLGG